MGLYRDGGGTRPLAIQRLSCSHTHTHNKLTNTHAHSTQQIDKHTRKQQIDKHKLADSHTQTHTLVDCQIPTHGHGILVEIYQPRLRVTRGRKDPIERVARVKHIGHSGETTQAHVHVSNRHTRSCRHTRTQALAGAACDHITRIQTQGARKQRGEGRRHTRKPTCSFLKK